MKRVLLITYSFPPKRGIGSVRPRGLAKYLPKFGWKPIILTSSLPGAPDPEFEVLETQYYHFIHYWSSRLGLYSKDIQNGSNCQYQFAVEAGDMLFRKRKIDAIISSSEPRTSHLIARKLKTKWKVPWIAELRDLWTQNYVFSGGLLRKLLFERYLELWTLSRADALVTVSKLLAEQLGKLHKAKRIYEIRNGFDPEEVKPVPSAGLTDKFTITHTGSLYGGSRDPSKLFEALRDLFSEGSMEASSVQVRFYGPPEKYVEDRIAEYGLQGVAKQYGVFDRDISLEKQRESHLLLLLNFQDQAAEGVLTGKVFEYLAAQRPILSLGREGGVIAELLNETNSGSYASTVSDIKSFLKRCYSEYRSTGSAIYSGERSEIGNYSHLEMARRYSRILKKLV